MCTNHHTNMCTNLRRFAHSRRYNHGGFLYAQFFIFVRRCPWERFSSSVAGVVWRNGTPVTSFIPTNYSKKCVRTHTQICVQIMCTNLRPLCTINGTTTWYFCTHDSTTSGPPPLCSMLGLPGPAAIPGSVLALASSLIEGWRNGY
jgi:hypothetical protein